MLRKTSVRCGVSASRVHFRARHCLSIVCSFARLRPTTVCAARAHLQSDESVTFAETGCERLRFQAGGQRRTECVTAQQMPRDPCTRSDSKPAALLLARVTEPTGCPRAPSACSLTYTTTARVARPPYSSPTVRATLVSGWRHGRLRRREFVVSPNEQLRNLAVRHGRNRDRRRRLAHGFADQPRDPRFPRPIRASRPWTCPPVQADGTTRVDTGAAVCGCVVLGRVSKVSRGTASPASIPRLCPRQEECGDPSIRRNASLSVRGSVVDAERAWPAKRCVSDLCRNRTRTACFPALNKMCRRLSYAWHSRSRESFAPPAPRSWPPFCCSRSSRGRRRSTYATTARSSRFAGARRACIRRPEAAPCRGDVDISSTNGPTVVVKVARPSFWETRRWHIAV